MSNEPQIRPQAIMVIWHGITDGTREDYLNWHTSEHMPERLAVPGFIRGLRAQSPESEKHPYITIYEADDIATFGSPAYLQRLNSPTPWSQRLHPNITNFIRGACDVLASRGAGIARSTLAIRMGLSEVPSSQLSALADDLCDVASRMSFVTAAKFGLARHDISGAKTKEAELRGTAGDRFDAVLLVASHDGALLRSQAGQLVERARAKGFTIGSDDHAVYELAYLLDARECQSASPIERQMR